MEIFLEIKEPWPLYDIYGKRIKGPVKPLMPFRTPEEAIEWLEMICRIMGRTEQ